MSEHKFLSAYPAFGPAAGLGRRVLAHGLNMTTIAEGLETQVRPSSSMGISPPQAAAALIFSWQKISGRIVTMRLENIE